MLSQQDEDHRQSTVNRSISSRVTPLTNDHVHIQHRNFNDNATCNEQIRQLGDAFSNDDIVGIYGRTNDETPNSGSTVYSHSRNTNAHMQASRQFSGDFVTARSESRGNYVNDKSYGKCKVGHGKRTWDSSCMPKKKTPELTNAKYDDSAHWRNATNNPNKQDSQNYNKSYEHNIHPQYPSNHKSYKTHDYLPSRDAGTSMEDYKAVSKQLVKNDGNFKSFSQ